MSMQAGILNFDGRPVDRVWLEELSQLAARFSPDEATIHADGPLGMVYRPFHTCAESRRERQPQVTSSGLVLTWDGRLDNREELQSALCDDTASDSTDVVLVKAAFEHWGTECLRKIVGEWALVVWNPQNRELILARDYIGVRSLFYRLTPARVVWCTALGPLAQRNCTLALCEEYIAGFLTTWPDANLTPFCEIRAVEPGHFVCIKNGLESSSRYWAYSPSAKTHCRTDAEYEDRFHQLFRQSVRRRLRSDSPVLLELSGGLDSSSIVCMADDILAKERVQVPRVDTFSFWDPNEPDDDDYLYFTKVEGQRGRTGHHAEIFGNGDTFSLRCEEIVWTPGFGPRAEVAAAKQKIVHAGGYRVLLSGIGGDEFLGGALDPRIQIADLVAQSRFRELAQCLLDWSNSKRYPLVRLLVESATFVFPAFLREHLSEDAGIEPWINREFAKKHDLRRRMLAAAEGSWRWSPSERDCAQTILSIGRQMTYFGPSMEESRYPYLDRDLVEFLVSLPTEQLLRPGQKRSLLRRALADLLPAEILRRTTKAGIGRCFTQMFEKHWTELEVAFRQPIIAELGYVNLPEFQRELMAIKSGCISPFVLAFLRAVSLEFWLNEMLVQGVSIDGRQSIMPADRATSPCPPATH